MVDKFFLKRLQHIHIDCFRLVKNALGYYLPIAGNIGIFCQSDSEYKRFKEIQKELTFTSKDPNQKYFQLIKPIVIPAKGDISEATYTHLYIRKPDPTSYEKYLGDVDFVLDCREYEKLKSKIQKGEKIKGAELYNRPGWDTIEISDPDIKSVAYVCTQGFAKKVRVKF